MKDNRHLYEGGIVEPKHRLQERNVAYLHANPLEKIKIMTMGEAFNAQQEAVKKINNSLSNEQGSKNKR